MKTHSGKLFIATGLLLALLWSCGAGPDEEVLKTYPDGAKQEVVHYEGKGGDRQMVAKIGYYRTGAVSFEERYRDGQVVAYRSWWPNGQLRIVRQYENDAPVSEVNYDIDGVRHLTSAEIEVIRRELADYPGEPATPQDTVLMETSAGVIKLRLHTDVAPGHCNNFKRLANFGYYDSTTFHRVVPGFVIQGGDLLSRDAVRANDGTGGPGYTIPAEFNPRPHVKGSLAMARSQDPHSAGSQFYIALRKLPQLDNRYTVFGEVIEGLNVVDSIAAAATDSKENPVRPQRILRVRVSNSEIP
ncbi:MAG: peptidylprolyl isomerase [Candidatus Neomarinimicrobiota bacterium]